MYHCIRTKRDQCTKYNIMADRNIVSSVAKKKSVFCIIRICIHIIRFSEENIFHRTTTEKERRN